MTVSEATDHQEQRYQLAVKERSYKKGEMDIVLIEELNDQSCLPFTQPLS